jgi:hypothetical protein
MLAKSTSRINNVKLLLEYCKNINDWPNRWEIDIADIQVGQAINEYFKLFLIDRIENGRAKRTIKTYGNYLWALGGELISRINYDDNERKLSAKNLILKYVNEDGGPYWRHARDESEQVRYDSVCKQLFKYMTKNSG